MADFNKSDIVNAVIEGIKISNTQANSANSSLIAKSHINSGIQDIDVEAQMIRAQKQKHAIEVADAKDLISYQSIMWENGMRVSRAKERKLIADYAKKNALDELKNKRTLVSEVNKLEEKNRKEERNLRKEELTDRLKANEHDKEARKELIALNKQAYKEEKADKKAEEKASGELTAKRLGAVANQIIAVGNQLANSIDKTISKYSQYQSNVNVRLQGTSSNFQGLEENLTSIFGAATPFVKTESLLDNVQKLAETGIAYNLEQRAFLATVSDNIAATFDAANSTLLQIIRLQQSDSTASRLGMEAYLTRYLNNMFENTEYLTTTFDNVTSALLQATSLMSSSESVEFEYIVQKWLGSLSGVGLSDSTATNLAQALGYLGSGDVNSLSGSPMQNLLVMGASRAGLPYSELLSERLTASTTNQLLEAIVEYIQDIAQSESNVVKSQYASLFGISVSDMTAALNLSSDTIAEITSSTRSYSDNIVELTNQVTELAYGDRLSMAEKIDNLLENAQWSMGTNIASSPVLSAIWKAADLVQSATSGINIPSILALGSGFDLKTTVENLVKLGLVGVGTFGVFSDVISSFNNGILSDATNVLTALGIGTSANMRITGGSGLSAIGKITTSQHGSYIGNESASDLYEQTVEGATKEAKNKKSVSVQQQESVTTDPSTDIKTYLLGAFDQKLNVLIGALGGDVSGITTVSNGTSSVSRTDSLLDSILTSSGQTYTAASSASDAARSNLTLITTIESNVSNIYRLMQSLVEGNALKVSVSSAGGGINSIIGG